MENIKEKLGEETEKGQQASKLVPEKKKRGQKKKEREKEETLAGMMANNFSNFK